MGELQWALLIVCVVLVIILYVLSRRGVDQVSEDEDQYNPLGKPRESSGQADMFSPQSAEGFDEFGVGKKRKVSDPKAARVAPRAGGSSLAAGGREPPEPSVATLLNPLPGQTTEPRKKAAGRKDKTDPEKSAVPAADDGKAVENKMIALILAHTEGNDIEGPALHAALREQGLRFGEGQVYHRMLGGKTVFSVANLIKPGTLVPEEAENFSTKGLAVVLNLPGPASPLVALDDMMETTIGIARTLKLGIFDAQRQPLTAASGAAMRADVEAWAEQNSLD